MSSSWGTWEPGVWQAYNVQALFYTHKCTFIGCKLQPTMVGALGGWLGPHGSIAAALLRTQGPWWYVPYRLA